MISRTGRKYSWQMEELVDSEQLGYTHKSHQKGKKLHGRGEDHSYSGVEMLENNVWLCGGKKMGEKGIR